MQDKVIILIVVTTISALLLLITILFFSSIIRRGYNARKYRRLDHLRAVYGGIIQANLEAGDLARVESECTALPKSNEWQAVEDVLLTLIGKERYKEEAKKLLTRLGYIAHYEKRLAGGNVHTRSLSIDKLGKMKSSASVPKLIGLLDAENPEIVSITVRTLSKIGGPESLQAIAERLPVLLGGSLVARKTMHTALLAFGAGAVPCLVERKEGQDGLSVASSILEILSRLPADAKSVNLAIKHLSNENAEIRSNALKVLGRAENIQMAPHLSRLIFPLLQDAVWFVRLQAIRSAGVLQCGEAAGPVGKLIFDKNWQVRNEAAQALIMLGECSLDTILEVLNGADDYAKDSVCEEIEKTGFSSRLLENLAVNDTLLQKKSQQVLALMCARGFSTTLEAYRDSCSIESMEQVIGGIMKQESRT